MRPQLFHIGVGRGGQSSNVLDQFGLFVKHVVIGRKSIQIPHDKHIGGGRLVWVPVGQVQQHFGFLYSFLAIVWTEMGDNESKHHLVSSRWWWVGSIAVAVPFLNFNVQCPMMKHTTTASLVPVQDANGKPMVDDNGHVVPGIHGEERRRRRWCKTPLLHSFGQ